MKDNFCPEEYIQSLGLEMVNEFIKAGMTTHTHAVGGGREQSVIHKLKGILPSGIGIGSGFVIDSYGNTSNQCDVIIYEENYAMRFIVNNDKANTYFNCECVIAVGEIKSQLSTKEIVDSLKKLKKINLLIKVKPKNEKISGKI